MLTKLGFEGFQSFGLRQQVEFAPLTLIFGPNSSGKSSIGRLLRLFGQSRSGGADLTFDGDDVQLGSLENVSFRNDPSAGFTTEFSIFPRRTAALLSRKSSSWFHIKAVRYTSSLIKIDGGFIESVNLNLAIHKKNSPIQSTLRGDLNLGFIGTGKSFTLVAFYAKGLSWLFSELDGTENKEGADEIRISFAPAEDSSSANLSSDLGADISVPIWDQTNEELVPKSLREVLRGLQFSTGHTPVRINRKEKSGFVPRLIAESGETRDGFLLFLDGLLTRTRDSLISHLEAFQYVGPLREITNGYTTVADRTVKLRSDGSNLQEHLASVSDKRFQNISDDLKILTDGNFELRKKHVPSDVFELGGRVQTVVLDKNSSTEVSFANSGAGLAQVIPILAGVRAMSEIEIEVDDEDEGEQRKRARNHFAGTLFIEQPELHLHPKMQANLVDFLLENTGAPGENLVRGDKATVICETHSESFLLRVQRRIRDGDFPASKVAIYFVDRLPGSDSSYVDRLEMDNEGNFIRQWPVSFSDLRNRER
jgi:ABC-type polar amino acid transport system ATPase subunit